MQALWKIHGKAPPTIFEMNIKEQARKKYLSDLIFETILAKTCSSFGILKSHRMQE